MLMSSLQLPTYSMMSIHKKVNLIDSVASSYKSSTTQYYYALWLDFVHLHM